MSPDREVRVSKFLSKHLRHEPQTLKLTLEPGGWVKIDDLLAGCAFKRFPVTREELDYVVEHNPKKRFAYDETGQKIRAQQGHSIEVDLDLKPAEPPDRLFHGTTDRNLEPILRDGLKKMNRHHVHLSKDRETAFKVGARHGRPVILIVDAKAMSQKGLAFYVSGNGVWLTDSVAPEFLGIEK